MDGLNLEKILEKAYKETPLTKPEKKYLLMLTEEKEISQVFETARALRDRYFSGKVFLYGFVYFSTHCRNNCAFCMYRHSNKSFKRYRKSAEEILENAMRLVDSGVHLLDLTMGEDPLYYAEQGFAPLINTVEAVKKHTGVPLMISPGVVSSQVLQEFKNVGVNWYACYQETHNRELYKNLRVGQSYEERIERKFQARKVGLLIEEGLLSGVGDTPDDVVDSLEAMKQLEADQVRVMSFVSQKDTPMYPWPSVPRLRELLIIAVMRLVFPDKLIPASLDVDGIKGLTERLDAGANVVTSIIPPMAGLAGVSQSSLDIDDGNRTVSRILPVLESCGLSAATRQEYAAWVDKRGKACASGGCWGKTSGRRSCLPGTKGRLGGFTG